MSEHDDYRLSRDYLAGIRLNLQHYTWKSALGYNIHPKIPVQNPNLKVADVGTGTGYRVWLCDLSAILPSTVQLDGFDVSGEQFPVPEYLPNNVRLYEQDAMKEPPQELQGQYDVVHVRLFLAVITGEDPGTVLGTCYKLLKPGGYLQWDELVPWDFQFLSIRGSPTEALRKFETMSRENMNRAGRTQKWIPELHKHFKQAGFTSITLEEPPQPSWHHRLNMENWCCLAEEFATGMEKHGMAQKANEMRQLIGKMHEEVKQGSAVSQTFQVVVGQKAAQGNVALMN